jgi:pimeloyl-ACP methyl ester carboxylesterase
MSASSFPSALKGVPARLLRDEQPASAPDRAGSVLSISRRGFHRVAYVDWGDIHAERVVLCVHALTRQGRDFDRLAAALATRGYRVVCPDLVGRGRSDWLRDPEEYGLPQFAMDMTVLIARLGITEVDWIGTSLGGLIGMVMAAQPGTPVRSLVLNDIGPHLPWQALHRIANTLRQAPSDFADLATANTHFRAALAPFGDLTDAEWDHLVRHSVGQDNNGRWRILCDPDIAVVFRPLLLWNLSLWRYWDAISCPTLVLRGETSDLLPSDLAAEMARRGPHAEIVEISGCGHAPALLDESQIAIVTGWLKKTPR